MAVPQVSKIPLKIDQYYQGENKKTHIILHHTAGGAAVTSIAAWAANPARIATAYVIDRDGTIYECFDPKYWSYHIGVKGMSNWLEKASIGIEICCYGALTVADKDHIPLPGKVSKYKKGDLITYTERVIPPNKSVKLDAAFRGFQIWEAYTPEQIAALKLLLPYLVDRFKITLQTDRKEFWEFKNPATLPPGIYSHTTVRKDKIDIFPQKEIVDLVYNLLP